MNFNSAIAIAISFHSSHEAVDTLARLVQEDGGLLLLESGGSFLLE